MRNLNRIALSSQSTKKEKYPGIIFDDRLKFQYHIENFSKNYPLA